MKKSIVFLCLAALLLFCNVSCVFADAAAFDMNPAGYNVYVATPDGGLNFRSGPGTNYNTIIDHRIQDGTMLYIEFTSGNWGYTYYNGQYGWVALAQTTTTAPVSTPAPAPESDNAESVLPGVVAHDDLPEPISAPETTETVPAESDTSSEPTLSLYSSLILIAVIVLIIIAIAIVLTLLINRKLKK